MAVLTGVGGVLCAAHKPKDGGPMHGHTWEVIVWLPRCDAVVAQATLNTFLSCYDHAVLPDRLTQGEDLAEYIGVNLAPIEGHKAVRVQVNRPLERIYAEWSR